MSTTSSTVTDPEPLAPRATSTLATRHGVLTLALLCAVAFLDFIDASIVNVALPSIRDDLGFTVQGLQWVLSGYLLTYGGFMLLGGRAGGPAWSPSSPRRGNRGLRPVLARRWPGHRALDARRLPARAGRRCRA